MTISDREAGVVITHLSRALLDGTRDLGTVPALVVRIVKDKLWRQWVDPTSGRQYGPFQSFEHFVTTSAAEGGLGILVKQLQDLCRSDPAALAAIEEATDPVPGKHHPHDNIMRSEQGTSSTYALRRLRKDRPDLHERVLAKELTSHAAMLEAGFRHKTITVRLNDPASAARALKRHMTKDDLAKLRDLL